MNNEIYTYKRGHLIDLMKTKGKVGTRIATYNCKKDTLLLYKAPLNVLLREQIFICASLEQMKHEYNKEESQ